MPDDDEINSLPNSSLVWMAAMISKDEEEEFERTLSFVEYLASFSNAEAVKQIREARENKAQANEESFKKLIASLSGREAPSFKDDK